MTRELDGNPAAVTPLVGNERIPAIQAGIDVDLTPLDIVALSPVVDATAAVKGRLRLAGDLGGTADVPLVPGLANKVSKTGHETIAGIKTFSSGIIVPDATLAQSQVSGLPTALANRPLITDVVLDTTDQPIAGVKTFASSPVVPDPTAAQHPATQAQTRRLVGVDVGTPGGVDDTALIHTAKAAAGVGGRLRFAAGTYVVDGLTASLADQHWHIPIGCTIRSKNGADSPTIDVTADGVIIEGAGTLDGNRANQTDAATGVTSAVRIVSRTGVQVRGLTIIDSLSHGIYMDAVTSVVIDGCTVSNTGPAGNQKQILVYNTSGSSSDVRITNNTVDSSASDNGCIAVTMHLSSNSGRRLWITGNRLIVGVHATEATLGVELFTLGTTTIADAVVANNVIEGAAGVVSTDDVYGISIGGTASSAGFGVFNCSVTGNTVRDCPIASIEVVGSGVATTGNTTIASGAISVNAVGTTGGMTACTVAGNTILDCVDASYAIHLGGGTHGLYGCSITGNVIRNSTSAANIYCEGIVFGATITGNTITDCTGVAIVLLGTFTDGVIADNVLDLTGTGATIDGILIGSTAVARTGINNNTIKGAGRNGIYGLVATSDLSIVGNRITHCNNGLKADAIETRWSVVANTISNSVDRGLIFATAAVDLHIASNMIHNNPGGNYYTVGSTFTTHVINGAGG